LQSKIVDKNILGCGPQRSVERASDAAAHGSVKIKRAPTEMEKLF